MTLDATAADLAITFAPICIYCGGCPATTDDHVMPRSRGGTATLPACNDITRFAERVRLTLADDGE